MKKIGKHKLYRGDCLKVMESIPDKSVDMILCDLPYGTTACKWDTIIPFEPLWAHYKRIIKDQGAVALFSSQPFTTQLIASNSKLFRYCWYWIKNQGTNFFHAKRMPIRKVEEICIFGGTAYFPVITDGHIPTTSAVGCSNGRTYFGKNKRNYIGGKTTRFPTNVLIFDCVDNYSRIHSSQKPVALLEYLIKTYTLEGETVLDNCMGSGSTIVACEHTKRIGVGIEKDRDYFKVAVKRIRTEHSNQA